MSVSPLEQWRLQEVVQLVLLLAGGRAVKEPSHDVTAGCQ